MDFKYEPLSVNQEVELEDIYTPKKLTEEEERLGTKKCAKCHKKYTQSTDGECFFHPGKYEQVEATNGFMVSWTCCRLFPIKTEKKSFCLPSKDGNDDLSQLFPLSINLSRDMNAEAFKKDGKGCQRADRHSILSQSLIFLVDLTVFSFG